MKITLNAPPLGTAVVGTPDPELSRSSLFGVTLHAGTVVARRSDMAPPYTLYGYARYVVGILEPCRNSLKTQFFRIPN